MGHRVTTAGATCGRHTSNAIVLPEAAVSRHHFSIEYKALEGRYFLIDEGSTTGTFMFLRPSEPFQLAQDMCIRAGATELVVTSLVADRDEPQNSVIQIKFTEGPMRGKTQTIGPVQVTIGRRKSNSLCIAKDDILSGQHCRIYFEDGGDDKNDDEPRFMLVDLDSTNGTGIRLSHTKQRSEPTPIADGDTFG